MAFGTSGTKPPNTIYRRSVKPASDNMLKPGRNNAKLGDVVTVKKWQGYAMYSLSLEERKTCPSTCQQWDNCYGNNMPFAHRFDSNDPAFLSKLEQQLDKLAKKHIAKGQGIVVRLHVLGDFFSVDYVKWWESMLKVYGPKLCVFGYTHCQWTSDIGQEIAANNYAYPDYWQIRFSDDPMLDMSAHVVPPGYHPITGKEVVCPEQLGKTASCADCGLCWSAPNRRIMFEAH